MVRSRSKVHLTDFGQLEEAPRPGFPDAVKLNRRQRWYTILVWSSLFFSPVLLIWTIFRGNAVAIKPAGATTISSSPGQGAARLSLQAWLAQKPSPIPGGQIVNWTGSTPVPSIVSTAPGSAGTDPDYTSEIDRFVVSSSAGVRYFADMQVAVDSQGATVTEAGPAITVEPVLAASAASAGTPWPNLPTGSLTPAMSLAINQWVTAFTSGNPASLAQVVGDVNVAHRYIPLDGPTVNFVTVGLSGVVGSASADQQIVRVSITPGSPTPVSSSATQITGYVYDVLINKSSTSAPIVAAWGSPGTGPGLVAYQNAVPAAAGPPSAQPTPVGALNPVTAAPSASDTPTAATTAVTPAVTTAVATATSATAAPKPTPVKPEVKPTAAGKPAVAPTTSTKPKG